MAASRPILPDVLAPGLDVVFCGSAAGAVSARVGAYYAGPGNRFWPMLHEIGLTPRVLAPQEFPAVLDYGIGLTDMCKWDSGSDASLARAADDPEAVRRKIARFAPRALAFNGKRAATVFFRAVFDTPPAGYGLQSVRLGDTAIFVLPSTSGAANRWWDPAPWRSLAAYLGRGAR